MNINDRDKFYQDQIQKFKEDPYKRVTYLYSDIELMKDELTQISCAINNELIPDAEKIVREGIANVLSMFESKKKPILGGFTGGFNSWRQ